MREGIIVPGHRTQGRFENFNVSPYFNGSGTTRDPADAVAYLDKRANPSAARDSTVLR